MNVKAFREAVKRGVTRFKIAAEVEFVEQMVTLDTTQLDLTQSDDDLEIQLQEYLERNLETPIIFTVTF